VPNVGDLFVGGVRPTLSGALLPAFQIEDECGALYDITILNFSASARLVMLLDQLASPIGAVGQAVNPLWVYPIAGSTAFGPGTLPVGYLIPPLQFLNGLWAVLSTNLTNPYSLTTTATNDGAFFAVSQSG